MNFELFLYKDSIVAYLIPHQRIDFKFKINFKFIFIYLVLHYKKIKINFDPKLILS